MNILIIGAGQVGGHLARLLSQENHDITVIDQDPERIAAISSTLDVLTIEGLGTSPSILREAGIESADMVISVTTVDEVNILACLLAKQFGVKTKVARVRNREFTRSDSLLDRMNLGIDLFIHPEYEATREIIRLVRYPQVQEMTSFCEGEILVVGLKIKDNSPISGMVLQDIDTSSQQFNYRFVAIHRNGSTIIPCGTDTIEVGDDIYVSCKKDKLNDMFALAGHQKRHTRNVMIYGASKIGKMVAEELQKDKNLRIKMIEGNLEAGRQAAEILDNTDIVVGEASDLDLINREGIIDMDVFAALTDDDEDNVVTSLLARHLRVPKTLTLIGKSAYVPIVKTIGLDTAINPQLLASNAILKYLRLGTLVSLRHMAGISAEMYEFEVSSNSKVVGKKIKDIKFPKDSIVVAVEHEEGTSIPVGDTTIFVGDRVVVFCVPEAANGVLKLFK